MGHIAEYFDQVSLIARRLDYAAIERMVCKLMDLRDRGGRLFFLGVGGSAANCSHAVNDFRKIAGIESYSPCDNVSELTARTNDEGWETVFSEWLVISHVNEKDALFVMSVGGGDLEKGVSVNIARALDEALARGMTILGVVGRAQGYAKQVGHEVIVVPEVDPGLVTPHAESFQASIWHAIVSHPSLKVHQNKWEGLREA